MIHIFTIGHSGHPIEKLLGLLTGHRIQCVVDVRTYPSSRHHPQYNRPSLDKALSEMGIEYRWAGAYLGGKREEQVFHTPENELSADTVFSEDKFLKGLERVVDIASKKRTAILCAEEDPYKCHRTYLIAEGLIKWPNVKIFHIRGSGHIEPHGRPEQINLFDKMPETKSFDF